jgi:hypothetical protein
MQTTLTTLSGDESIPIFERVVLTCMQRGIEEIILPRELFACLKEDGRVLPHINPNNLRFDRMILFGTVVRSE